MNLHPAACPLDCPDRCSLDVGVVDGRVASIAGSRRYGWTDGYICAKVRGFGARVYGPGRVLRPRLRVGSSWRDIGWDDAMALAADRIGAVIRESGPEALLPVWYGGSNGWLTAGGVDQRLWNRLGASRCLRTLCAANTDAGTRTAYGDMAGADLGDVEASQCVVLWGVNPSSSGIHLVPPLKRLQARGGTLAVVDPRRTPLAAQADVHLPVLPGCDVPVALAVVHVAIVDGLVDQAFVERWCDGWEGLRQEALAWSPARAAGVAGVEARGIERLAHLYAASSPALIRCGWGVERNRNGSDSVRAVVTLPAIFGKFGVRGGGYALSTSSGYGIDSSRWQGRSTARGINLSRLGAELEERTDPPIRACWIYNCNPVATVPDQARVVAELSRPDRFVVVHEQTWTDTCEVADLVLPATTFLEHHELSRSYSGYVVQWSTPAIAPVGEARTNHQVLQDLGRRLGSPDEISEEELARDIVACVRGGPSFEELRERHAVELPAPVQFVDTWPSGKVALSPPPRHREAPGIEWPLVLISPATSKAISSTLYEAETAAALEMNADDAAARGLGDGDIARAFNDQGEVVAPVKIAAEVRPGVVVLPKGLWRRATRNGWTSNALIPSHVDEHGGGACYNDARVEVEAQRC